MLDNDPLAGTSKPSYISSTADAQLAAVSDVPASPDSVNTVSSTNAAGESVLGGAGAVSTTVAGHALPPGAPPHSPEHMPGWSSTNFNLAPLPKSVKNGARDFHRKMRKTMNVASQIIDIIDVLYQVIDALQSDFNNLYKLLKVILVELLKQLQDIIVSLASTGIYMLPVLPDFKRGVKGTVKPGGFDAVLSKVTQKLVDPMDPNRPMFSDSDAVGGILAVLTAGTNVGDLVDNFNALGAFIKGFSIEEPALGELTAVAGLYRKPSSSTFTIGMTQPPGVRLTWKPPVGLYKATKYHVRRCKVSGGIPRTILVNGEWTIEKDANGNQVTDFVDAGFNGGKPFEMKSSRVSGMTYTDFEVTQGVTYFYRVVPVIGDVEQDGVRREATATVTVCIPDNEFTALLETPDGLRVGPNHGEKPDWQNQSLKELIGPALNEMLKSLIRVMGTLASLGDTATDAFADLLALMKRWVAKLKVLLEKIAAVLAALDKLKFAGGAAILKIEPNFNKGGGITRLSKMINSASMSASMRQDMKDNSGLCSITAAIFIVVGVPSPATFSALGVPNGTSAKLVSAGSMGATSDAAKKAWAMVSALFGDGGSTSASANAQPPAAG